MNKSDETVGTLRERERESYNLVKESVVLLSSLTHTSKLIENKIKNIDKKAIYYLRI